MEWFTNWWEGLELFGQILACAAIPATVLLVLQTLFLLLGGADGHDADHDIGHGGGHEVDLDLDSSPELEHDAHDVAHSTDGLRIFTVRGFVAFFAVGGWTGLAVWDGTRSEALTLGCAVALGTAALVFAAFAIKWMLKLQDSGNIDPRNAIASMATVYIPIPPARAESGRVTLLLQERYVEMEAVTDSERTLKTGETVQVVGVVGKGTLITRPIK